MSQTGNNTTKFTVAEFLIKPTLVFFLYSVICWCWENILPSNQDLDLETTFAGTEDIIL